MSLLRNIAHGLRSLFRKERVEGELEEELRGFLEMAAEEKIKQGMSREGAVRDVRLERGNLEVAKETVRAAGWESLVETCWQDLHLAARMLRKGPAVTVAALLTLALGIGVNTAIFSVLNGWLFRPLPVPMPDQIVVLASQQRDRNDAQFSYPELDDFRKQADTFSDIFAYALGVGGLTADGKAGEFAYSSVSGNYFSALNVKPVLGRLFLAGEGEKPGEVPLVVLGYSYWKKRFGGDLAIVGKQVRVNGKPATVIGVAAQGFHGTLFAFDMDGYLPLGLAFHDLDSAAFWSDRNARRVNVLARLKPGVTIAHAQSSVDVIAKRLSAQYPESEQDISIRVISERLARPAPFVSSFVPIIASLFLFLAGMVLLLACMNVANLLLARITSRHQEMAVRAALGASRFRLIRQMLTECLLLALLGSITGVCIGEWAMTASGSFLRSATTTTNFAYSLDYSFDWNVFAYTSGSALLTAILVGLWPAFRASRSELSAVLQEGHGYSARAGHCGMRRVLVVAQVAGSLTLLVVAGLFARSLEHAENMYLGFDPQHVLNIMLDPHQIGYDETQTKALYSELKERVHAIPGVESASLSYVAPLQYPGHTASIYVEGRPLAINEHPVTISFNSIDSAYFDVMRVPLLSGRTFIDSDNESGRQVAIVNQTMAKKLWPKEEPIGKQFSLKSPAGPFMEVVGVAANGQYLFLSPEPQAYFYVPLAQNYSSFQSLQVRSSVSPEELSAQVQGQIRAVSPDLPPIDISSMERIVHGLAGFFVFRLAAALAAVMGVLALALAVIGLYGVVSFGVSSRTREIGTRMALGAQHGQILQLVLGRELTMMLTGLVSGLVVALILSRAIVKLLIGISAADPLTYFVVASLLAAVTLLACWIPARRAMHVDPIVALRYE